MKLLSIAIPCYNSENYMQKCIESLLIGGDDVEIIIINDGSTDRTAQIADEYFTNYPSIVKVIHQENGGHGEAVNTGIKNATGLYFKVVDSDDWVNDVAYNQILDTLRTIIGGNQVLDMLISNFVYEKQGATHKKIMSYKTAFPQNVIFTWRQVKHFHKGQYILMHSVIYRTQLLIDCGLELPKHTFYVDNLFVYQPLPSVKTLYYLNVNFYRYFIGRDDQSVHESVMIKRVDQQILVNQLMIDSFDVYRIPDRKLRNYMISYLDIITTVSSILLIRSRSDENFKKKQALWKYLKQKNGRLYFKLRFGLLGRYVNLPGKGGRTVSVAGYKLTQKFFGFN